MRAELKNEAVKEPYVLIIEDDLELAQLLCDAFKSAGSRCFVIRSKTSAEQFLRQVRPDLVVVDYKLIGGVGLEVAQIASEKNVPVIVTSGHSNIFEQVKKAGYLYLMKPFRLSELLALASTLVGFDLTFPGN